MKFVIGMDLTVHKSPYQRGHNSQHALLVVQSELCNGHNELAQGAAIHKGGTTCLRVRNSRGRVCAGN